MSGADRVTPTNWLVPTVRVIRRERSVWQVLALGGYAVGSLGAVIVAWRAGDSPLGVAVLAVGAAVAFLVVTAATMIVVGEEIYVFFHHAFAVGATTCALAATNAMGVARSLDYAMAGLGLCLAVGRIGCLMVGCCHGRPAPIGVVYGESHIEHGFPPQLVGCRLVPVQAIEAAAVLTLTAVSIGILTSGGAPGTAATVWVVIYAASRFVLEYLRGEPRRPGAAGLNHAQWTAVVILGVFALAARQTATTVAFTLIATLAAATVARWRASGAPRRGRAQMAR